MLLVVVVCMCCCGGVYDLLDVCLLVVLRVFLRMCVAVCVRCGRLLLLLFVCDAAVCACGC